MEGTPKSSTRTTSGATMTGAWNHALGRASVLVERLDLARRTRLELVPVLRESERAQEVEGARLALAVATSPDLKNEGARKAQLVLDEAGDEAYRAARYQEGEDRDRLAQIDAEIAADHDRLGLVKRELDWLIATAGQQREEGA